MAHGVYRRCNLLLMAIEMTVNGRRQRVTAAPETPLLLVLRNDLQLNGPKFGCGLAQCGACIVHLDGDAVPACVTPLSEAAGRSVVTIEGLGGERLHPLQQAFLDEQAAQCGYCTAGIIMKAAAVLRAKPDATEAEMREALAGNLCRCGSHMRVLRAIRRVTG
ncbi:MAG: (2Fe-2S)-binding protein [Candidatus Rokubacteria bacterium]|nr:(2Fe-2S)-binding protein [Candidatus Rokubacteria bacterium]